MADIQSAAAEIRSEKKERTNDRMKIQWSALFHRATINNDKKIHSIIITSIFYRKSAMKLSA